MTYLIIDDEPVAHDIIKGYCDLLPNMNLMKHCYDAIEALDYLRENPVDLIFLDLNMPKLKGFEFLRIIKEAPAVIVTTAYKEHALEGFELDVVDYLLKPFSFERLLKAINKSTHLKSRMKPFESPLITEEEQVFLYSDKKHIRVKLNDILFVEAAGNYCKVVLAENQILIREKISDVLDILDSEKFIQVHKSFIVSKNKIETIQGNRIQMIEHQIPVGKSFKNNLVNYLRL
ncbi:LytR/AlgR family response regulator transcription factor [Salinimicrobium sp. GXAS 041]|uniref:LytR/AlgR family response regulator transcription factor n=1 Tax=Salinimicrobium sp. GXAS 041 TaxID=3400806 RepID=UPI003C790BD4